MAFESIRTPLFWRRQKGGGVTVQDTSLTTGSILFVGSTVTGATDSTGYGFSPDAPLATLDYAIGRCTANKADIIYIMPGHAQTFSTSAAHNVFDVAGITVIGLGKGADRPTFTFTHTGATQTISANGVTLRNLLFVAGIDSVVTFGTVSGADCTIEGCETRDATDIEVITDWTVTGDRFTYRNNLKNGYTDGNANVRVIGLNGVDRALIEGNRFVTKVTTAVVNCVTAASTAVVVKDNVFLVSATTDGSKNFVDTITGSTWSFHDNFDLGAGSEYSGGSGAALASDDVSAVNAKIGTITNTGGTATIGGALGDLANVSILTRLNGLLKGTGTAVAANKSLVDALGSDGTTVTDSAVAVLGAIGADNNNNAFASTNVAANADGSVLERLEFVQANIPSLPGLVFRGATDAGMVASTTAIVCAGLAGYGDDYFNTKYYMQVVHNVNSDGNAPEPEVRQISDYVSATGTFTTVAFSANVEATDGIQVLHECLVTVGRDDNNNTIATTNVAANEDGSLLERLEQLQEAVNKGTGTPVAANKSLVDALGTDGTTVTDSAVSVLGAVGANSADNSFASGNVAANEDGSVLERLEQMQEALNKGTGTPVAANKSLVDALGTDGTTVTDAAVSVLGAIGADNANNAFASTLVAANRDGSVLERLEGLNADTRGAQLVYNTANYLAVTADGTLAAWQTVATHEVFTVTGMVRMRIIAECTGDLTSAGAATIQLGIAGATTAFIANTDALAIDTGEMWFSATPAAQGAQTSVVLDKIVSGGTDVGYEVVAAALTGGTVVFHCWWEPLNATGAVAAGDGSAL